MARVLAISSHVVRGHVGLGAAVPALQWLGHEVWALPTVLLASRPGLGRLVRHEVPAPELQAMLEALEADGCWGSLEALFAGYFPSAASVMTAADAFTRIKLARPDIPILVDPILGDAGRLYVSPPTAEVIRDRLLPLATIATPNLFELQWLTGARLSTREDIFRAARSVGVKHVVITSAVEQERRISTILVGAAGQTERACSIRPGIPNGAGDLFAGLLLGRLLNGQSEEMALEASLRDLDRVLAASEHKAVLEISALNVGSG
jgi:pyridoxine kinase